ncbi:DNA translocase FtsK [Agrilactobacillus yilanensis]|uniref:DNA translocase FtsK n=1 Tax=Agrilactobacillus yilanensis TaxID=2485997 RepID=A0ABW4JA57_9LACO|nr:DNA translocase FtsK [Agrilactobacillus yilanensis]
MARTKNSSQQRKRTTPKKGSKKKQADLSNNIIGFILVLLTLFSFFKWGVLGALFANVFRFVGGDTYYFLVVVCGVYGVELLLRGKNPKISWRYLGGTLLVYLGVLLIFSAYYFNALNVHTNFTQVTLDLISADFARMAVTESVGGGMAGAFLYSLAYPLLSQTGTYVISSLLIIGGLLIVWQIPFKDVIQALQTIFKLIGQLFTNLGRLITGRIDWAQLKSRLTQTAKTYPKAKPRPKAPKKTAAPKKAATPVTTEAESGGDEFEIHTSKAPVQSMATAATFAKAPTNSNYQLPTPALLTPAETVDQSEEYQLIKKNKEQLKATLASFGVDVSVKSASLGPSITKYEVQPAVGIKVSKIVNLADDLALALAARDIRIEAPIPGKPYVGIEVPNKTVAPVAFRNVIETQPKHEGKILEVPLGQAVSGEIITMDLTKMPHLLIAGSTGSGKSVAINTIITSILMQATPEQVRLMLVDPKMVELNVYNGVPHLLIPVVTDAKKAAGALNKAVKEMERRYQQFADNSVRNITEYNQLVAQQAKETDEDEAQTLVFMPYIVIVVDELSDLMMVAGNEVEGAIVRLAQMARAAGIHMIIATQRPSVDVITGLIKANIPSRIAFAVSSGIDSRTILDTVGAEKLLGRGDMLYAPIGTNKPTRVQGAFISVQDVEAVVDFVSKQQEAQYDETMVPTDTDDAELAAPEDELYEPAVELVIQQQKASVSMLQRRFRIGYNHAARIVDEMEAHGIVGPPEGSRPRRVLKPRTNEDNN